MTAVKGGRARLAIPARPRPVIRATDLGATAVLKQGTLFLLADAYGNVVPDRRGLGLYLGDTRVLSTSMLLVEGRVPTLLRPDPGGSARGVVQLTNPDLPGNPTREIDHPIALPRQSVGIQRVRDLGPDGALREHVVVANYTMAEQQLTVRLLLEADAADIFEVRGYERERRGELRPVTVTGDTVVFAYRGLDGRELRTTIRLDGGPRDIAAAEVDEPATVAVTWPLRLGAGAEVTFGWEVSAGWRPPAGRREARTAEDVQASTAPWAAPVPAPPQPDGSAPPAARIDTDDEIVNLILERAFADLRLLSTPGPGPGQRFVAAGVPWFSTLFGRDSLVTGFAALPYAPDVARDALAVLADLQSTTDDPGRDAEPGKILHEMRTGEMAHTGELPFDRYYGAVDTTPLWLLLVAETAAWTGDGGLVDRLWPAVEASLAWLEQSPHDADGFLTYEARAAGGLRNQGWKDSADAIRDRDGNLLDPPIALAEVQAYAVDARRRIAVLARARGLDDLAAWLERRAAEQVGRFDARFWQADIERYAMALGPRGAVADALGSNMGHCLWAGIVPPHRAGAVARDLLSPALFSGWGVRTYGADQPGFNPLGYHTGSLWPHDSAIAAAGLKRYGFHEEATTVAWAVLDAARHTPGFRLPELFCGFDRATLDLPVVHPVSCAPQAWAAAAALLIVTTMLGLVPRATAGELEVVRPVLPRGLSRVVVTDLAIGAARVDLLFHRWRGTTSAEVLGRRGDIRVVVRL